MIEQSLRSQTARGVLWSTVERFSVQGVQFLLSFVIARQLSPSDYGLIAMLAIFMALAQMFVDAGFSNALIQKQQRTDADFSTVFYFNIVVGIMLYGLIVACAPLISNFYDQPQLKDIIVFVGLNFIITAFGAVQRAKLTIALDFRRQAYISFAAVVTSGALAVYMAYKGYGVWTLVAQGLVSNTVNTVLLWLTTQWRPKFVFSIASFKDLFGFGSKILVGGFIHALYTNLYTLIIGKCFSPAQLGLFTRAQHTTQIPSLQLTAVLIRVTYPVECRLQNDNTKLADAFYLFVTLTAFGLFPLMVGLAVLAEPLVRLVLTEKWIDCVPLMQILCFAYMFDPVMRMNWDILNVKRRSDYSLKSEIIKKIMAFAILMLTFPLGLRVMCIGLVAYSLLDMIIIMQFTRRVVPQINIWMETKALLPILIIALMSGGLAWVVCFFVENDWAQLFLGGITILVSYVLLALFFRMRELKYIVNIIKSWGK